jgi:hypothetical protein
MAGWLTWDGETLKNPLAWLKSCPIVAQKVVAQKCRITLCYHKVFGN